MKNYRAVEHTKRTSVNTFTMQNKPQKIAFNFLSLNEIKQ
jgi:hypothetical protein